MPSPFRTPEQAAKETAAKQAKLAEQAAGLISEGEGLSDKEKGQVIASSQPAPLPQAPSLHDELNKVLGPAVNTKTKVESKTVDEVDLSNLDETTLLKYPIEAKYLNDDAAVSLKPRSSTIVLRWCYFNSGMIRDAKDKVTATNMGRYKHMGFEFASVEDIEGGEDALIEGIIDDGGKIFNYDTVLMKVDKIRLMGHYKKNLLKSLSDMDRSLNKAANQAKGEVTQTTAYQKAMALHPQAKVDFYSPVE